MLREDQVYYWDNVEFFADADDMSFLHDKVIFFYWHHPCLLSVAEIQDTAKSIRYIALELCRILSSPIDICCVGI